MDHAGQVANQVLQRWAGRESLLGAVKNLKFDPMSKLGKLALFKQDATEPNNIKEHSAPLKDLDRVVRANAQS